MHSLIQTIYASRVSSEFQEHQIPDLLKQIRPANAGAQVTGMLLYFGTSFLQVLEGPAVNVDMVYSRVKFDPRHTHVTRLTRESLNERQFPDWTMDFATVDPMDADALIGQPNLRDADLFANLNATYAKLLLAALKKPSWSMKGRTGGSAPGGLARYQASSR